MAGDSASAATVAGEAIRTFLGEEVLFDRYIFPPGDFPGVRWKDPDAVRKTVGSVPLTVEFYNRSFARVDRAAGPGIYGAVVRGTAPGGFSIVRYITLYCCNVRFDDYGPEVPLALQSLPEFDIPTGRWEMYRKDLRRFSFGSLLLSPEHDPDAAIFLAGLSELDPAGGRMETPRIRDRQWWLEFKRKNDGKEHPPVSLSLAVQDPPAPVLADTVSNVSSAFRPGDIGALRQVCGSWTDSSGVPAVALIVHEGKIVFWEAFGRKRDGTTMARTSPTWMASITKLLTGVVVMQLVDRGVLDLDAPIDRYLPELATSSTCPLTLRLLLTHTSGLSWAGEWASDWNPALENEIAQAVPYSVPGTLFRYHRVGYALAGKVLERVSGQSVPLLFENLLFAPLGMESAFSDNTYGGLYAPALDLAKLGLMLLDHGRYGSRQYLSGPAWDALLPRPLRFGGHDLRRSWGIGTAPLAGDGLGEGTFGHEAASGAIFRIDPVHNLVVVLGRDSVGPDERQYKRFVSRFLRAVVSPFERGGSGE